MPKPTMRLSVSEIKTVKQRWMLKMRQSLNVMKTVKQRWMLKMLRLKRKMKLQLLGMHQKRNDLRVKWHKLKVTKTKMDI